MWWSVIALFPLFTRLSVSQLGMLQSVPCNQYYWSPFTAGRIIDILTGARQTARLSHPCQLSSLSTHHFHMQLVACTCLLTANNQRRKWGKKIRILLAGIRRCQYRASGCPVSPHSLLHKSNYKQDKTPQQMGDNWLTAKLRFAQASCSGQPETH